MTGITKGDYTGYSDHSINGALENALEQAGEYSHFEIIETRGSSNHESKPLYQILISAYFE
ncbi:hypothetical protein BN59_00284 [Legionella massiliensis]|uniref:Uncharacterized protein n=1 Tax=Legionella massiliensis TaxID=1034943 RepID=A0A078KNT6_9GAMM|nr:hypothetical protein [Legionella massiliensis]CDZ76020.1 hypothetical protein BN59_00284 [Legionella massiliensis]CEE11758.1 hypothetical protein BN1094_00284 [Legionella massiliensis]